MISLEEWTTIRYLKAQGLGTRKIARQLGISRNKVRRAMGWDRQPQYQREPRSNSRLEPLRDAIKKMLLEKHFIGSRILEELQPLGYKGSKTAFYDYLAKIKAVEGKTKACIRYGHLSISLGIKACGLRKRVLFTSATALLENLVAATVSRTLGKTLEVLARIDLLIVDELGYMPIDAQKGNLFFQVVSRRYEKSPIILNTNKSFDRWGEMFGDDVIASAILDRLLHHCHIIPTSGPSYRIKDKLDKVKKVEGSTMERRLK